VAEQPAPTALAQAVLGTAAGGAAPAGRDAGEEDVVADPTVAHATARLDDGADGLVAEHPARRHLGDVALQDVEVGAADRGGVDLDHDVLVVLDLGIGNVVPALGAGTVEDERTHGAPPRWW
jgi:hypothetical protein